MQVIEDPCNLIFLSSAALWELQIKIRSKKLIAPKEIFDVIGQQGFEELPITHKHVTTLNQLESHHKDPFDRIMMAQSLSENLIFLTQDKELAKYKVNIL